MVRTYKRTSTRGSYGEELLQKALDEIKDGVALTEVAKKYKIPAKTLRRHRDGKVAKPGKIRFGRFNGDLIGRASTKICKRVRLEIKNRRSKREGLKREVMKKKKLCANTEEIQDPMISVNKRDQIIANLQQEIQLKDSKIKEEEERFSKLDAETRKEIEGYKNRLEERNQKLMEMEKSPCGTTIKLQDRATSTEQLQEIANLRQQLQIQESKMKEGEERFAKLEEETCKEIEDFKTQLQERNQEVMALREQLHCQETVLRDKVQKLTVEITHLTEKCKEHQTQSKELSLHGNFSDDERWTSIPALIGTIEAEDGYSVSAVAISDQELFIAKISASVIDVYDLFELDFRRKFEIDGLKNPEDLAFCKIKNCLYILDKRTHKIIRSNTTGEIINMWSTRLSCDSISVAFDSNIIFTSWYENLIVEYTPEGKEVRRIKLSEGAGRVYPMHSIKLRIGCFLVIHEGNSQHRVCVIDLEGHVKMAFGGEKGSDNESLDRPKHIAINSDGSIIVTDWGNNRLMLLDANLKFKRVLISSKLKMHNPLRLAVDESTGRLFVVQWDKHFHVSVYKFFYFPNSN